MSGTVQVAEGSVRVDGWETDRFEVVRWFEERLKSDDGPKGDDLLDAVVTAGVLALKTASVAIDADYVGREFERLLGAVGETMVGHGERLEVMFDPQRNDSVVGSIREVMADHVDGRDSKLARLLDLTNDASPLRALADGMEKLSERVDGYRREVHARDAADAARAEERELGTAKGHDFEEIVLDALAGIATACGDSVELVGDATGSIGGSKRGDIVIELNRRDTRGLGMRVGVEVKDTPLNAKSTREQLNATKANRDAVAAFAVFARSDQMPKGMSPFADLGENRFACLLDKDDADDVLALSVTYRIARHWALAENAAEADELDLRAMHDALEHARNQLQSFTLLKRKVTQLESGFSDGVSGIREELDRTRLALTDALDLLDEAVQTGDGDAVAAA